MTEIEQLKAERDALRKLAYVGEHMHDDCSWKVRFAEIKAERDELKALLGNSTRAHAAAIERERALAAHVERLRQTSHEIRYYTLSETNRAIATLLNAIDATPQTSLDRLIARKQAEVLEELINQTPQYKEANPVRGLAGHMADNLRQQAEGE